MDVSRFYGGLRRFLAQVDDRGVVRSLQQVIDHVDRAASDPSNASVRSDFLDAIDAFRKVTETSAFETDADLQQTILLLHLDSVSGSNLYRRVHQTIAENSLTPQQLSSALRKILEEVMARVESLRAIEREFKSLDLAIPQLDEDDGEVLTRIPIESKGVTLEDLSKESHEWYRIFETISEVFDFEKKSPVELKTISQGSWLWYLAGTPAFIYGVAKCLKGVNQIMVELLRGRELLEKLRETRAPEATLAPIIEHQSSKVNLDLKSLANALVDEHYTGPDTGRKNELKAALSQQLIRLSKKLAEGRTVQLRLPPMKARKPDESTDTEVVTRENDEYAKIQQEVASVASLPDLRAQGQQLISVIPNPSDNPSA